ncbi:MAG: hypothetical protein QXN08_08930 [Nitrososphaerales archaeon]
MLAIKKKKKPEESRNDIEYIDFSSNREYIKIGNLMIPRENILNIDIDKGIVVFIDPETKEVRTMKLTAVDRENLKIMSPGGAHGVFI